jgi:positive regulator of sigma E activity
MVELYLPPGKTVLAGFVALLVPVLLFPVGYSLPSALVADVGEGVRIISGIGGIAGGFMISRIFSKAKAKEYIPKITRVIDRQTN